MSTKLYRPLLYYLREWAPLEHPQFLERCRFPLLLWPQREGLLQETSIQFETYSGELSGEDPFCHSEDTESSEKEILVIEVKKRSPNAPEHMVCVGRAGNNDIVFANDTVSKLHAYFLTEGSESAYEIVDANSTNGTRVGNKRLEPYQGEVLDNGDQIHFGPLIKVTYLTPAGFYQFLQELLHKNAQQRPSSG
ncbi:MAG: FHA domain-containing protein [Deltaproteobacteria bacterium]|nr:FHA domain-containing protein [Deltaproteobacteria bacterium]MBW2070610.1 FHA domain-containing protein [Deltaproteobacteria bacterium]